MKKTYFVLVILAMLYSCSRQTRADRIYINAKIWTGDSSNERVTSLAVKDSTILFAGVDYSPYQGPHTEVIDLGGRMVVPGFIDNHTHFLGGGYQLASIDLRQVKSQKDFIAVVRAFAQNSPANQWIQGGDWDHEAFGGVLPTRYWIDSVCKNHPVFVSRYDGHMVLVNSIALRLAGIDSKTPNPPGGEIVRDALSGEPTGVLKDEAMNLVGKVIPGPSRQELEESLKRAQLHAFEHGVTQVHDMGSYGGWLDLATYRQARQDGRLQLRIYSFVPISTWKRLDSLVKKEGRGDERIRWGGLKGFMDGSLGSTTAWFYQPYLDAPGKTGLQVTDTTLLRQWILAADAAGLQVATHAIGDRANDFILGVYEQAGQNNPGKDHRFRVEHAQHLTAAAIARFASLHVIASMQPYHAIDDGKWAFKRLDSQRLKGTYAFKSLLAQGATVTFGSDWTVAPLDPVAGIYAAVTRRTLDDKNPQGWFPDEKISVEQALRCYTSSNAYGGFQETRLGQLKSGMLADFVVLSDNLFEIAPEKIRDIRVLRTVINGQEVYHSKP